MFKHLLLTAGVIFLMGCAGDKQSAETEGSAQPEAGTSADNAALPQAADVTQPAPGTTTGKKWHYTCPKGHQPGSDSATVCATCGTMLEHSQAFHDNPAPAPGDLNVQQGQPQLGQPQQAQVQPEPPQNSTGAWHYICPKGHPGGAGEQAPCPTCGATLEHNDAYHAGETPATQVTPAVPGQAAPAVQAQPAQVQPEPPQNAAGVWHYTCPEGHAGGAGAQGNCATCGAQLQHNQGYHN